MTVGETLAEARNRAGLSVDELGQRTKIREQVIRAIEHDDFDSCGGTLYVRGYVRVIAGAVGVDAQALLRELDKVGGVSGSTGGQPAVPSRPAPQAPRPPQPPRPQPPQPPRPAPGPATPATGGGSGWGAPPTPVPPAAPAGGGRFSRLERLNRLKAAEEASRAAGSSRRSGPFKAVKRSGPIKMAKDGGPAKGREPDPSVIDLTRAAQPTSADLSRAGSPETLVDMMRTVAPDDPRSRDKRDKRGKPGDPVRTTSFDMPTLNDGPPPERSGSGFGVPAPVGGAYDAPPARPAPSPAPPRVQERRPLQPPPADERGERGFFRGHKGRTAVLAVLAVIVVIFAFSKMSSGGGGNAPASASSPSASATPTGPTQLTVSQCQAWGPNGTADGDNPTTASYPITPGAGQPWITQQYSSAQFGGQKSGSGLLLDMGKTVTVSGVTVDLGSTTGSGLELKAGNDTSSLSSVSTVTNVSGSVEIRPGQPVKARYLLIWFNQLPQASDGQYQASVYHIGVQGAA